MDTKSVWEKAMKRKTNFCLIQGHSMASCKALYLPLGSVFLLDILSPMNCHSSHLRSHKGSMPLPGHTHWLLPANRHTPVVRHPLHSENHSCHRSSSAGIFVLCPSFPNLWTHTLVHLWQAAAASWPRQSPTPPGRPPPPHTPHPPLPTPAPVLCSALRHLCLVRQMRRGNFRADCWNRTRGPPQKSYITVRSLAVYSLT